MADIIERLKARIYLSESPFLVKTYMPYFKYKNRGKKRDRDDNLFINYSKKFIFIHNPKVAGKSIKKQLGLSFDSAIHLTPSFLVDRKTWDEFFTIVAVRNPIDRLISSFHYHTKEEYTGVYFEKYPFLHSLNFEEYFKIFKNEPWAIRPQTDYLHHLYSEKKVDFVIRYENLQNDMDKLCGILNLPVSETPYINKSPRKYKIQELFNNPKLKDEIIKFYKKDFEKLNYQIDEYFV